jgi:hypothetical protein
VVPKDARFGAHFTQMYTFSTDSYHQAQLDALEAGTETGRRDGRMSLIHA